MIKVKICGIRTWQEAAWAVEAGTWAVGFVFAPSRRQIEVEEAARIIRKLPGYIHKVGVFVDMSRETVEEIIRCTDIDLLQFHGRESPEYCVGWRQPVIKSFSIRDEDSLTGVPDYQVFAHLFDTYREGQAGGTGITFDWRCLATLKSNSRVILAGGLTAENVSAAVKQVRPFAVDVSSGVESFGCKDRTLIQQFISQAQNAYEG